MQPAKPLALLLMLRIGPIMYTMDQSKSESTTFDYIALDCREMLKETLAVNTLRVHLAISQGA